MTSLHVTCHVTAMSHASSSSLKRNSKEKKSRKIDKRKRKMLVSKCSITTNVKVVRREEYEKVLVDYE